MRCDVMKILGSIAFRSRIREQTAPSSRQNGIFSNVRPAFRSSSLRKDRSHADLSTFVTCLSEQSRITQVWPVTPGTAQRHTSHISTCVRLCVCRAASRVTHTPAASGGAGRRRRRRRGRGRLVAGAATDRSGGRAAPCGMVSTYRDGRQSWAVGGPGTVLWRR